MSPNEFNDETLSKSIKDAGARYASLLERSRGAYGQKPNIDQEALVEMSTLLEELNVTHEELRAQNDALRDAYSAVEEERRHFQDLFHLMPEAYFVTDEYGTVLEANDAGENMVRLPLDRLRGKPLAVFAADDVRKEFRATLANVVSTGERAEFTTTIVARDKMPTKVNARVALLSGTSAHKRIGWLFSDISEKNRAATLGQRFVEEQNARIDAERAARRFRALAEASRQLSVETDIEVICRSVAKTITRFVGDHCEIMLLEGNELASKARVNREPKQATFADALRRRHNMMADDAESLIWRAIRTGDLQVSPQPDARDANSRRDLFGALRSSGARNAVTLPLTIGAESIGAIVVLSTAPTPTFGVEDIGILLEIATRASQAIAHARIFADLEKANSEKADFLAILSHELRTPLSSAIGYSELLLAGIPEKIGDAAREQVERIRACSWHQLGVVEQILRYARVESGEDHAYLAEFDVPALLHEVKEIVLPNAAERNMEIVWDVPASPLPIRSDAGRLRQILVNLMSNAIKFTDEGAVSLSVRRTDEEYYFVVSDTGIGISEDDTKHIFEPFWRAAAPSKMRGGSGLGLAVSMQLARSLNGTLHVQSQLNVGTTVTLRLPIT